MNALNYTLTPALPRFGLICTLCVLFSTAMLAQVTTAGYPRTVHQVATARDIPNGSPKSSDVCFSSRWLRPETFDMAAAFHATRFDWVYARGNEQFVSDAKAKGYAFGATLNSTLADAPGKTTYTLGRSLDLDGKPIVAPWMVKWGTAWGCANHPDYRQVWLTHAQADIDAGANAIQMDGPGMGYTACHWGGCFCGHCIAGYGTYLANHTTEAERRELGIAEPEAFDYAEYLRRSGTQAGVSYIQWKGSAKLSALFREFQKQSTLAFFNDVHAQLDAYAGKAVPYSCNGAEGLLEFLHETHDFGMAEWYPRHEGGPAHLYHSRVRPAVELGVPLLFTYVSTDVQATRRFIALTYAFGSHTIVPWDVYIGSDVPRLFGAAGQFADLFGFVRANAQLLDGYEDAAVAGPGLYEKRYSGSPPVRIHGGSGRVYATVRCKPGAPEAPVAIHLVDYDVDPQPFTLILDPRRFDSRRALSARLLVPTPYDESLHRKAERTTSYARLSQTVSVVEGYRTGFSMPALSPYGIVVVESGEPVAGRVWQPAVWANDSHYYRPTLTVRMTCATTAAMIRYTTDGTEPTQTSPSYGEPFDINETTDVRARAFLADGTSSDSAEVSFKRLPGPGALPPDHPKAPDGLCLWVHADVLTGETEDGAPVPRWPAGAGPDLTVPNVTLFDGVEATPPTFVADAVNGQPMIRFEADSLLAVAGFANRHLAGRPFTVLMVTRSEDASFGISGNAPNGSGGAPRLYLTRSGMIYDELRNVVQMGLMENGVAITTYLHDGVETAATYLNGTAVDSRSDVPVTATFGGGHLSIPFWSGRRSHVGEMAELIIFDRPLPQAQRERVEAYLGEKYRVRCRRQWR